MNLRNLIIVAGLCLSFPANAQSTNLYTNLNAYNEKVFETVNGVKIERRSSGDIGMSGGNDYKITADDKDISKDLKKTYWAVERNDSLFLNTKHLMDSKWYALVLLTTNYYMYFRAGVGEIHNPTKDGVMMASALGGAIGAGFSASAAAKKRYDYVLNRTNGNIYFVDKPVLDNMLKSKPALQQQLRADRSELTSEKIVSYLKQL